MNRRDILKLGLGLGVATPAMAGKDKFRDDHYPPLFYTLRTTESKEPGIHRMKLDNRTLEITLPEPPPSVLFMPEAVMSKGEGEVFQKKLRQKHNLLRVIGMNWKYGLFDGALSDNDAMGGISATIKVKEHTRVWIKDSSARIPVGTTGDVIVGERPVELDYSKLADFILAVHSDTNPNPYWVEVINGRQWVREIHWVRDHFDMPPTYQEYFYTPIDQRRILKLEAGLSFSRNYDIPEGMPGWMQRLSQNITAVLRSLKISPPSDGSPDPLLIDKEQKAGTTLIEFPARRR